ncbi:MAG: NAD-dependent epimerase/dehydratase family protein [Solirubrobacteraceae bacterium]
MPPAKRANPSPVKPKTTPKTRPKAATKPKAAGLTVAVTGPTGEIGRPFIRVLEKTPGVERIIGMARSPFDAAAEGWKKTTYRQGDVLDRRSVDALVKDADVVVHLAFLIMGSLEDSRKVNVRGSRNVFQAAAKASVKRLVYTSSVAAYGFHKDSPKLLREDRPAIGTDDHYYSAQKAEVEDLLRSALEGSSTEAYVFRPCIVAGPQAPLLIDNLPYTQLSDRLPSGVLRLLEGVPILKPVLPDPGVPFQLVHHDDVAQALRAAVLGKGEPGIYNLAGSGEMTMAKLADELGWYSIPIPELAVGATAEIVSRLSFLPAEAQWINAFREPVLMDTAKARKLLDWRPQHDALETLRETIAAHRSERLVR